MPMQTLTAKPARRGQGGQAKHVRRPTKLQIACQKAFGASKSLISGIKRAYSPIDTCVNSYEIHSSYVNASRLLGHSTSVAGTPHATRYEYDAAGRLAARKVQGGSTADLLTQRYGYDSVERLAQIKYLKAEGQAGEQLIEQIDYRYDAAGRRTGKTSLNNNGIGYVEGNPVSYADPLGLWSVTVGAYLGVGGQMTFGNDGGNGFMTARFGFGLGGNWGQIKITTIQKIP